jgi:hypothetical protein
MGARVLALVAAGVLVACGPESTIHGDAGPGQDAAGQDDGAAPDADGGPACVQGRACGDGGICTSGDVCCTAALACGAACCEETQVCSFQQCRTPGAECVDGSECGAGEYCDYSLGDPASTPDPDAGCQGGATPRTGRCMPRPPTCPTGQAPGDPPSCVEPCQYRPPVGQFSPALQYSWGDAANPDHNVMMAPVVVQLDDDNCDGVVDERDIPEIVFMTFSGNDYNNTTGTSTTLRAISIVGGQVVEKWSVKHDGASADVAGRSIAAGDIDGVPGAEIVTCTRDQRVRAHRSDGTELWLSDPIGGLCFMPALADVDQDGIVEVVTRYAILDGRTGALEVPAYDPPHVPNTYAEVVVSDLDGDGVLDVVAPGRAYRANGTLIADTGLVADHPAVGDLDNDGVPEVAAVTFANHTLSIWRLDATATGGAEIVRQGIDINSTISPNPCCTANPSSSGCTHGGGPPTIADFNGDGHPDVGLAGGIGYIVFDGAKLMNPAVADADTVMWLTPTQDCSSAMTGSSVFDFDGNGSAEVVYGDEIKLHIYDGATGAVLFETCNTSGTLWEYPLVADVTNDGHADIVVASNSYSSLTCAGGKTSGIRVFGDTEGKWVRTRRIWNQHSYHVTNVDEDGSIPRTELPNYRQPHLNNFRQNVQPEGEFAAPDLIVTLRCADEIGLIARVYNVGEASVPPGVVVGYYDGDPTAGGVRLGEALTTQALYSLGYEDVFLRLTAVPAGLVYAVVDDGSPPHSWHECRTHNNTSQGLLAATCVPG